MIAVATYTPAARDAWNAFVAASRNGTFLFHRDYMEYHADRFRDGSLLFYDGVELVAILPASDDGERLVSHAGLTYGGLVTAPRARAATILECFDALAAYAREHAIARLLYKRVPSIYHRVPSDEDLYALFRAGALLVRRDLASAVRMSAPLPYSKGRHACVVRSRRSGVTVAESADFAAFMAIEEAHLQSKYNVRPVHTAAELELLASRFPANIRLFTAARESRTIGGVVIYETDRVAHAQYIAANEEGKEHGAIDAVIDHLLTRVYAAKPYFDFGISTEQQGRQLNSGLIANKESYGARGIVYDAYELTFA